MWMGVAREQGALGVLLSCEQGCAVFQWRLPPSDLEGCEVELGGAREYNGLAAMPLLDAPQYDPRKERRKPILIVSLIIIILLGAFLAWKYRNWPEEHAVDKFLTDIEHAQYEDAYAVWNADPNWKQHPDKYKNYTFGQFQLDWGPSGDYGKITKHDVLGAAPSGENKAAIVAVRINDRPEPTALIVDRKTKEIGFSPVGVRVNTF